MIICGKVCVSYKCIYIISHTRNSNHDLEKSDLDSTCALYSLLVYNEDEYILLCVRLIQNTAHMRHAKLCYRTTLSVCLWETCFAVSIFLPSITFCFLSLNVLLPFYRCSLCSRVTVVLWTKIKLRKVSPWQQVIVSLLCSSANSVFFLFTNRVHIQVFCGCSVNQFVYIHIARSLSWYIYAGAHILSCLHTNIDY